MLSNCVYVYSKSRYQSEGGVYLPSVVKFLPLLFVSLPVKDAVDMLQALTKYVPVQSQYNYID